MKAFIVLLIAMSAFAESDLAELKKMNTKASFLELQKNIKPGRLSGEKAERLNKMIQEGKYILPPKTEVLKAHEEVQLKGVISSGQSDIEEHSQAMAEESDDGYKKFLTKISDSEKVLGPKKVETYVADSAPVAPVTPVETPEVKEENGADKEKFLGALSEVMATKDGGKSDSQFQLFYMHSETYKNQIIPQLIKNAK